MLDTVIAHGGNIITMALGFKRAQRVWLSLFALSLLTAAIAKEEGTCNSNENDCPANKIVQQEECGVYFAESTIPGGGYTMFAGQDFQKGSLVLDGDLALPIMETDWHNNGEHWIFVWEDYTWEASEVAGMEEEVEDENVHCASFGFGAAINSFLSLVNLFDSWMTADNAGLHRSKDPGAGAFTPYHGRQTYAKTTIEQGAELFVNYGENYFETRAKTYGMIPLHNNYKKADELLLKYKELVEKLRDSSSIDKKLEKSLWNFVTRKMYGKESRTINALPQRLDDIDSALWTGTAKLFYNHTVRDMEWLRENGKCADNLRPGPSTIPQAGRGAFATRFIPKGAIVAPAPLIHIADKKRLLMYEPLPKNEKGRVLRNESAVVGQQLLLNYCFGHSQSSLLLSPYGALTNLINHSSKRPNARIQWASNNTMRNPEWLDKPVHYLAKQNHAGLVLDYIALKDIQEGEEVLIDYGKVWEDAWNEHVKSWTPPKNAERYHSGLEMTHDLDMKLWPYFEPPYYAPSIQIWVHDRYRTMAGLKKLENKSDYHLARIVKHYELNGKDMYMVELITRRDDDEKRDRDTSHCTEELVEVLFGVPKDALYLEDDPYTRDIQLRNAFRHEMMIPDDIFPEAWKNQNELS